MCARPWAHSFRISARFSAVENQSCSMPVSKYHFHTLLTEKFPGSQDSYLILLWEGLNGQILYKSPELR